MAPALPLAPREPPHPNSDTVEHHRRQVLASVDNLSGDDVMGLQNHPNMKEAPLSDNMLVDLSGSDLLSVIKTLETNNDTLSTGDADSIFPLDLPETGDSESDPPEQKIMLTQVRIERRCAFLLRRLRILQARALGKRVSEEVAQTFEKCTKGARKDGGGRPIGLKALLKRVETTATLQASAASRSVVGPKYYNPGSSSSKGDASKSASVGIPSGTLTGLEDTAGALKSHLSVLKHELDSDATASSSGAESNDEAMSYTNPNQQPMPIEKRALWTWQRERASIASRWSWLQAQVQELEYKIRQHTDLHKQVREAKGPVEFEGEPVGYEGSLPGSDESDDPALQTCARVRPLRRETFKKRKLLQMHNLHVSGNKASRSSDIRCSCQYPIESCAVCTGRAEPTALYEPHSILAPRERIALVDPGYHPVLSDIKDVGPSTHMAALCSRSWFRPRATRGGRGRHASSRRASQAHANNSQDPPPPKPPKKREKLKRGRPPLSRKVKEREREDEPSAKGNRGRTSTESRSWRRQSYDIDNIVIPQSVAANNRPQILEYKEIITPKWRVMELPDAPINGVSKRHRISFEESDEEDVSEASYHSRHVRAETRERTRYTRPRQRRAHHEDASHAHHEAPPQPHPQPQHQHQHPQPHEVIPPYSPRRFPLPEDAYVEMLAVMPQGYRPETSSPGPAPMEEPLEEHLDEAMDEPLEEPIEEQLEDDSSTLSPMSPSAYEGDDPDDLEWEPSVEKSDRKKSTFR